MVNALGALSGTRQNGGMVKLVAAPIWYNDKMVNAPWGAQAENGRMVKPVWTPISAKNTKLVNAIRLV